MTDKALDTIYSWRLLKKGDRVVVALSGGADSMALLSLLCSIKDKFELQIVAAHLNHNLRGDESKRDEQFVRDVCKDFDIPLTVYSEKIAELAKETRKSVEECGRERRYALFEQVAGDGVVATAHTLSDNIETFFINLLRGTGLKGLCGIPVKRGRIIRPLIACTRKDILNYCEEHNITYVEDSSNFTDDYLRNRIRNHLIPVVEKLGDDPYHAFSRMFESLRADELFLSRMTDELVLSCKGQGYYDVAPMEDADPALARRALLKIAALETGRTPEAQHIGTLFGFLRTGGQLQLPGNHTVRIQDKRLEFVIKQEKVPPWEIPFKPDTWLHTPSGKIRLTRMKNNFENKKLIYKKLLNAQIDYDKIIGKIYLRNRREGDQIRIQGRGCTKTVKKWMNEKKIPIIMRDRLILLVDEVGIVWMQGFGAAERCAVSENTRNVMIIETEKDFIEGD